VKENENRKIVFYDGDCSFCNRTVQFIVENNKKKNIYFSSLQSSFSDSFFGEYEVKLTTFYFYDDFQLFSKSKAAIRLSRYLSFPYSLAVIFLVIPVCFRDKMYDFIAKRRSKLSKGFCASFSKEEQKRFID